MVPAGISQRPGTRFTLCSTARHNFVRSLLTNVRGTANAHLTKSLRTKDDGDSRPSNCRERLSLLLLYLLYTLTNDDLEVVAQRGEKMRERYRRHQRTIRKLFLLGRFGKTESLFVSAMLLAALLAAPGPSQSHAGASKYATITNVQAREMLDKIQGDIKENYYDPT